MKQHEWNRKRKEGIGRKKKKGGANTFKGCSHPIEQKEGPLSDLFQIRGGGTGLPFWLCWFDVLIEENSFARYLV